MVISIIFNGSFILIFSLLVSQKLFTRKMTNEYIVIKISFLKSTIWKYHFSITVLNSFHPLPNVFAAISPCHLSITISFVIFIFSFIMVSTSPFEFTLSTLLIILIFPVILVSRTSLNFRTFFPFTFSCF